MKYVFCRHLSNEKIRKIIKLCYYKFPQGEINMDEQLKVLQLSYKDLKNTLRLFKDNKYVINNQIDIMIAVLTQMKSSNID